MNNKNVVMVAFDIETRGPSPRKHGINAIGYCVGHVSTGKII